MNRHLWYLVLWDLLLILLSAGIYQRWSTVLAVATTAVLCTGYTFFVVWLDRSRERRCQSHPEGDPA
jgi:hypothetical protein